MNLMKTVFYTLMMAFVLVAGTATAQTPQINTPAGAVVPFGANQSYPNGIMPTNLPTGGAYGKSQDAANAYNEWVNSYVVSCGGSPVRYRVKFDEPNRTVSEGIAYGMLLAAYAADKAIFDGLWAYYKANANGNGFLHWRVDGCSGISGNNGATDADLDAAFALLVADNQWPTATTPYDYTTEATTQMNRIKQFEIHNSSFQAINGDGWGFGDNCRNPSYQSPAYYKEFATKNPGNAAAWNSATTAAYNLLNANAHATTGLVSDWSNNNGVRNTCNGSPLGVPTDGYGYDACRNPWRMATDAIWNNDASGKAICTKIATYVNGKTAGGVRGPVYQDGTLYSGNQHNATFVSTFAMPIMGTTAANQTLLNQMYTETKNTKDVIQNVTLSGYFGNTLRCVSLFMMSGNFWKLGTTSQQDIHILGGALDIPNAGTYDFQNQQTIPPAATGKLVTFTIQNKGFNTLNLTGTPRIVLGGANPTQFILTESVPATLNGNTSTTFTVQFRPTTTGTKTATLTIASNDPDEGSYVINLTGVGTSNTTASKISVFYDLTPIANGGSFAMGTSSVNSINSKRFKIKNTGDAPLNITSIVPAGTGYALVGAAPTTCAVNDSVYFYVRVTAAAAGTPAGSFTINNNDVTKPAYVVNLTSNIVACNTALTTNEVVQDFDANYSNTSLDYANVAWQELQANPLINTTNPSNSVAKFTRPATGNYNGVRYETCIVGSTINVTASKYIISVLVYSPAANIPVLMNLKTQADVDNTTTYPSTSTGKVRTTKVNQWERLYFDHSAAIGVAGIRYLEVFVDPGDVANGDPAISGAGAYIYYIDDIKLDVAPCLADIPSSGILQDYDNHRNMSLPFAPPGTFNEVFANPSVGAQNGSATVAYYIRPQTTTFQIIRYKTCGTLDLSAGKTLISMQVYSPKAGVPVLMSLKDAATGTPGEVAAVTVNTTVANAWETLYFDFAAVQGSLLVKAIDVFIDPNALNSTSATVSTRTYYLDNIMYATAPPCAAQIPLTGVLNDYDANRYVNLGYNPTGPINEFFANPNATGINTSATVANFVRPATVAPDVIHYKACGTNLLLTSGKSVLSLQVLASYANAEVILSLKKANQTTELAQAYARTGAANTWAELNFDFSDYIGSTEAVYVDIILDPNGTNIGTLAQRTYNIDNLRYSNKPEINVRNGSANVLNGDDIAFGSVLIGDSVVVPLSLINTGAGDLLLTGTPTLKVSGLDASQFYVIQSPSFSTTVTGGSAVGFSVVFKPTTVGAKVGAIEIVNNDATGGETPYFIDLTGTATCAAVGAAGTITGAAAVCSGATGITYSITAVAGATGYTWTVPTGASITAGATTNSITVTMGSTAGNVTVTPTNACASGTLATKAITINTAPATPGAITGTTAVCSGTTGLSYGVTAVAGAASYTWTVPTGASITAGGTTNGITVTMGSTAGNVTVTATNTCGTSAASSQAITINTAPGAAGTITGATTVCSGQAGVTYSITAIAGATGYTWTVPTGASITAGGTTNSITVTMGSTAGNVTVTPTNTCGSGTSNSTAITISGAANPAGAITGSATVCSGATGITYAITAVSGATGYTWTVPTGASITAGSGTAGITVTFGTTSGNVTVTPTSTCGSGASASQAVTVNPPASAAGTITGSGTVCSGATGITYSIASVAGATGYTWTVPTGASITAGGTTNSITVTMGSTAGNVTVTPTSACGNGTLASLPITINTVPAAAGTITGATTVCSGQAGVTYSIVGVAGATSYTWTVPTGASITAGGTTNSITVTMGSTAGNVSVTPTNTCGSGTSNSVAVAISGTANPAGAITGSATVCSGATGITYSITAVAGATGYTWTVPTGASITAGSGTTGITVTFGTTSGNVTVTPTSTCGSGASASQAVTVNPPASAAGTITGSGTVCSGATGITYSIASVAGATGYTWLVPTGASITAGSGTTGITVTFGSSTGNITVTPTSTCGNGTAASLPVTFTPAPGAAGTITGPASLCNGATGQTYSITAVSGATSYSWSVPSGSTITAGATTNSITLTFGGVAGNVTVTPSNACGSGASASLPVTLFTGACTPPTTQTITGPASVTAGQTVTYSVGTAPATSTYNWSFPAGTTIVSATPDSSSVTVVIGSTSGNVVMTETNAAGSVSSSLPVTVSPSTGINSVNGSLDTYEVYPTPFAEVATLKINSSETAPMKVKVMDSKGVVVYSTVEYFTNQNVSVGNGLAIGVYYVEISYKDKTQIVKIVKM